MDILLCYANFNTILKQSQYLLMLIGKKNINMIKCIKNSIFREKK